VQPLVYEIYNVSLPYRVCVDIRPAVIIKVLLNSMVTVALLSSAMDLYLGEAFHFLIHEHDPDFSSTGLKKTCYIAGDQIFTISYSDLINKRGCLTGETLSRFKKWI
jgi:hypothetical protein